MALMCEDCKCSITLDFGCSNGCGCCNPISCGACGQLTSNLEEHLKECDLNPANFPSEIEVAIRDLEDEFADGLISANAYEVRKAELQALLEEESN